MKIFTKNGLLKKLIIVLIALIIFNAIIPTNICFAGFGGALLEPIAELLCWLGDVVVDLIHDMIYGLNPAHIRVDLQADVWEIIGTVFAFIVAAIIVAAIVYFTAGLAAKFFAVAMISAGTVVAWGVTGGTVAAFVVYTAFFGKEAILPMYRISPEEIFAGEVALLNANFFDPIDAEEGETDFGILEKWDVTEEVSVFLGKETDINIGYDNGEWLKRNIKGTEKIMEIYKTTRELPENLSKEQRTEEVSNTYMESKYCNFREYVDAKAFSGVSDTVKYRPGDVLEAKSVQDFIDTFEVLLEGQDEDTITVVKDLFGKIEDQMIGQGKDTIYDKPLEIWCDQRNQGGGIAEGSDNSWIGMMIRIKYFTHQTNLYENQDLAVLMVWGLDQRVEEVVHMVNPISAQLKESIAKWYYAMRTLALIVMMVILLYIGIRIMLCGIASEKAKYKNMLTDWFVAVCLIFIMHYIMVFSMNLTEGIIKLVGSVKPVQDYIVVYEYTDKMEEALKNKGIEVQTTIENEKEWMYWDAKNMMGVARVQAALQNIEETKEFTYVAWVLCFLTLVVFTISFLFTYIKRIIYLAFLTIIAPLVAMTYPLDKLHDGKAQAFNMWFKEYIFNLMIQPVHLLLYTVLISSAFELASENVLYMLVAIGFMMPAEKFLRKMFGFEKAQTPGFLSGGAGAGLAFGAMNKLFSGKHSKGHVGEGGKEKSDEKEKIKFQNDGDLDVGLLGQQEETSANTPITQNVDGNSEQEQNEINRPIQQDNNNANENMNENTNENTNPPQGVVPNRPTPVARKIQAKPQRKSGKRDIKKPKGIVGRALSATTAYGRSVARQTGTRLLRNVAEGKPIRAMGGVLKGAAAFSALAMLGAVKAMTSGNPKDLTQSLGVAAATGYGVATRRSAPKYNEKLANEEAERAKYNSEKEYQEAQIEKRRKEFIKNEERLRELQAYMGLDSIKDAKEYAEQYGDCIDKGIEDTRDIATIATLEENGWDRTMAMTASKQISELGGKRPSKMNKKEYEDAVFKYKNILRSKGMSDEDEIDRTVITMFKNLEEYGSTRDGLTKL